MCICVSVLCLVTKQLLPLPATLVFYVPPHGLAAILADMADVLGPQRQTVVARELTKLHEEFFRWVDCGGVKVGCKYNAAGGMSTQRSQHRQATTHCVVNTLTPAPPLMFLLGDAGALYSKC